mgnify:CR=1 FL=1
MQNNYEELALEFREAMKLKYQCINHYYYSEVYPYKKKINKKISHINKNTETLILDVARNFIIPNHIKYLVIVRCSKKMIIPKSVKTIFCYWTNEAIHKHNKASIITNMYRVEHTEYTCKCGTILKLKNVVKYTDKEVICSNHEHAYSNIHSVFYHYLSDDCIFCNNCINKKDGLHTTNYNSYYTINYKKKQYYYHPDQIKNKEN